MRIGIDARIYGTWHGGIGRYAVKLIAELEKIDAKNEYFVFLDRQGFEAYIPQAPNFKKVLADYRAYSFGEQFLLPVLLYRYNLDLVHFTHFNAPFGYFKPFVVTIHDLIITRYPDSRATTLPKWVYWLKVGLYKMLVKIVAHRAKKILTVSQFSAKDIEKYLGVKVEKIEVIYNGVDALPKSDMALAGEWKKQLGITKPFLFYVGSAYPHKNLEKLIDAMLLIKQHHDVQLVLGGKKNYFYQQLQKYITDKNLTADVILVDYLNDEQLAKMYRLAQLYVFPSLIEGFGLPPLEAQASDCPVVASNYSCLPEVLGDSVVYFDPTKTEAIAQAVNTVLADDTLREKLITLGKNNWPKYTWGRCAQEVLKVYLGK